MEYEILARLLLAALWGGLVGVEREYRGKSAGFRTMIMISMGSCFFTMMSEQIGAPGNADRIASNIVTGIGFLGAGVIFRGDNRVNGITTAATIWGVASVGMGIGGGYYFAAAIASILILIVLSVLPYIEQLIDKWNQSRTYIIKTPYTENVIAGFEELFQQHKLKYRLEGQVKEGTDFTTTWLVQGSAKRQLQYITEMNKRTDLIKFEY